MKRNILTEKSTWAGVVSAVCVVAGWTLAPEQVDVIASAVAVVAGGVLVWIKERDGRTDL
jgi:hypothetical protein